MQVLKVRECVKSHRVGITLERILAIGGEDGTVVKVIRNEQMSGEDFAITGKLGQTVRIKPQNPSWGHWLQRRDVLLTTKFVHDAWAVFFEPDDETPTLTVSNTAVLRVEENLLTPEFLVLWLRSDTAQTSIKSKSRLYSRGMHSVPLKLLLEEDIYVPSLDRQQQMLSHHQENLRLRKICEKEIRERHEALEAMLRSGKV